jgi:hypothetical protein
MVGLAASPFWGLVLRNLSVGVVTARSFLANVPDGRDCAGASRGCHARAGSMGAAIFRLPLTWALSVVIEAGMLVYFRKKPAREVLRPVLLANVASYLLLGALILVGLLGS